MLKRSHGRHMFSACDLLCVAYAQCGVLHACFAGCFFCCCVAGMRSPIAGFFRKAPRSPVQVFSRKMLFISHVTGAESSVSEHAKTQERGSHVKHSIDLCKQCMDSPGRCRRTARSHPYADYHETRSWRRWSTFDEWRCADSTREKRWDNWAIYREVVDGKQH